MGVKRGVFFTTDALIALIVVLMIVLVAFPIGQNLITENALQRDILVTLSSLKVGETNNLYLQSLNSQGLIEDQNKTLLEQIGEFYVKNITLARELSYSLLSDIETNEDIGLWFGDTLVWSSNSSPYENAKRVETRSQLISGLQEGEDTTGFSARALLSNKLQTKYFYFGGYVGDGNITSKVSYEGTINSVDIEVATTKNFSVYVNNVFSGNYAGSSSQFIPVNYEIPTNNFDSGNNTFEIRGNNINLAGGFIKIRYTSDVQFSKDKKYKFPGIDGLVNIYDGVYVPSNLTNISISLHLDTNFTTFLNVGNTTLFSGKTNGEETKTITNSQISSLLNYEDFNKKTIPIRLGIENVSYVQNITSSVDVFSVNDLSGSMCSSCSGGSFWCCITSGGCSNNQPACLSCGGTCTGPIESAKNATKLFVDLVLNSSANQVGLVGYANTAPNSDFHPLSNNSVSLKNEITSWRAVGNTCICCGIIRATANLTATGRLNTQHSMVVMSDGEANVRCYSGTGSAKQDAVRAACEAYQNYSITVNAIGFGSSADETTLQQIASCGNGTYYFSDVDEIGAIYSKVAQDIIEGTYIEQTVDISGNVRTKIFSDSYIDFGYTEPEDPFGLIITSEKSFTTDTSGSFSVPSESEIIDARIMSYSGSRWTDKASINNNLFYNLSKYGSNYISLGDPYAINIPLSLINYSSENQVTLTTGNSPQNSTSGSSSNKIILTVLKNASGFAPISAKADGCSWTIQFEDLTNLTIKVPSNYTGSENCVYSRSSEIYNENDAIQTAVYNLLLDLDFDNDGLLDIYFDQQDLEIDSKEVTGIPFVWSTEVQVRRWQT